MNKKSYVGDGVYVEKVDFGLELTTSNGIETTNRIVLEPEVWQNLLLIVEGLAARSSLKAPR